MKFNTNIKKAKEFTVEDYFSNVKSINLLELSGCTFKTFFYNKAAVMNIISPLSEDSKSEVNTLLLKSIVSKEKTLSELVSDLTTACPVLVVEKGRIERVLIKILSLLTINRVKFRAYNWVNPYFNATSIRIIKEIENYIIRKNLSADISLNVSIVKRTMLTEKAYKMMESSITTYSKSEK